MSRPVRRVGSPQWRHRYPGEILNLVGHRYGRLTGVQFIRRDDYGRSIWLWSCDCGQTKEKRADQVRNGSTHSCGCLRKRMDIP
jgi:hypothetical protein